MSDTKNKLSQLLSAITKAKKEGILTDDEKRIIKEYIFGTEPDLTLELEKYNKDKDLKSLMYSLKVNVGIEGMTSPMDNMIYKKKKKKQKGKKKEENFEFEECDIGASPICNPKKRRQK